MYYRLRRTLPSGSARKARVSYETGKMLTMQFLEMEVNTRTQRHDDHISTDTQPLFRVFQVYFQPISFLKKIKSECTTCMCEIFREQI